MGSMYVRMDGECVKVGMYMESVGCVWGECV